MGITTAIYHTVMTYLCVQIWCLYPDLKIINLKNAKKRTSQKITKKNKMIFMEKGTYFYRLEKLNNFI